MVAAANMVEVAALIGDTARATMLSVLMGGQAFTASELAARARICQIHRQRTSGETGRYYHIASPLVATMLEGIEAVTAIVKTRDADPAPKSAPKRTRRPQPLWIYGFTAWAERAAYSRQPLARSWQAGHSPQPKPQSCRAPRSPR
jgi:hypothetical protein